MTALLATGRDRFELDVFDEFTGFGGSLGGITKVPFVKPRFAANHSQYVLDVSQLNYPWVEHFCGDVQRHDITKFRPCVIFWASPACPKWTNARGVVRDFDKTNQESLPGMPGGPDAETVRSRLLMDEVHRYLEAMWLAGQPVLAGVVENVVECRKWDRWAHWRNRFHLLGYKTRLVALNSGHVRPVRARRAPQSRDRLYLVYWLEALGRDPDFDKWLRPRAWCPRCDRWVDAIQSWKRLGADMGRYRAQYVYRCPSATCRNAVVEPEVLGAVEAIDWSLPSTRIGDRAKPLEPKTMARIGVGTIRLGVDVAQLAPAGGTWRQHSIPLTEPMPARTTRETDGLAVPPMLVPTEGRPGKVAMPVTAPGRTQTTRNETGLAIPPFVATLRGGGSAKSPNPVTAPLTTVTASGNHHGLVTPPEMLIPYYSTGVARPVTQPMGTLTTVERYGLGSGVVNLDPERIMAAVAEIERIDAQIRAIPKGSKRDAGRIPLDAEAARIAATMGLEDFQFRMLEPHEIAAGMGFDADFRWFGSKRDVVRGLGNAVTGCVSEVLVSALVEAIVGDDLDRELADLTAQHDLVTTPVEAGAA